MKHLVLQKTLLAASFACVLVPVVASAADYDERPYYEAPPVTLHGRQIVEEPQIIEAPQSFEHRRSRPVVVERHIYERVIRDEDGAGLPAYEPRHTREYSAAPVPRPPRAILYEGPYAASQTLPPPPRRFVPQTLPVEPLEDDED